MIRLGLRLTLGSGKEAITRLGVIAAAVALGVGLLLGTLAALNATGTQNDRNSWLNTGLAEDPGAASPATPSGADPLWWMLRADHFQGKVVGRIDVAATGPRSPVPPGIPRLPAPGEFYVSPALGALLGSTPAAQLADRYPGHLAGTIGNAALPGPNSLLIVTGHRPDELAGSHEAAKVTAIMAASPSRCDGSSCVVGTNSNGMVLILSVVAAALIFPVLVLIGTAARLSAARREQRFAAMRLIGATPRQISVVSAVESTLAAAIGVVTGFGLFFLIRPLLVKISFTGTPFFPGDLALTAADTLLVALGVPVAAAASALIALRRVRISPLGVSRRVTPPPPRAFRMIPVLAGLLELACFIGRVPPTSGGQVLAFLPGILVVMGGIVFAGPWLTLVGASFMARRARRPAPLVAGRRLSDDPKAGFRAVSGLVLALCVTSTAVGVITGIVAERGVPHGGPQVRNALIGDYFDLDAKGEPVITATSPSDALLAEIRAIPGVGGVTVIHPEPHYVFGPGKGLGGGLATCAQLSTMPDFGTCPAGALTAAVNSSFSAIGIGGPASSWPTVWPAAASTPAQIQRLPVEQIVVTTDGSAPAIEQARTVLAAAYPDQRLPFTVSEDRDRMGQQLEGYRRLADVVVAVSFPIAGCGLAVSVAGGLNDRRRPFGLLRLAGVRLAVLRRVVLLESAVPLLVVAAVAIGTGLLVAELFLKAQFDYALRAPGTGYYLIVVGGLAAALGVITSTLPLLGRITGPETVRNE